MRVCPRCGSPAGEDEYCKTCGLHLFAQPELPTREGWERTHNEGSADSQPSGVAEVFQGFRRLGFPGARNAAAAAALLLLVSMFLPLWGVLIKRDVTRSFDVVRTTEGANAWQAFQWQDWVMTGAVLLGLAVFIVSLSQEQGRRSPNVAPVLLGFLIAFGAGTALLVIIQWMAVAVFVASAVSSPPAGEVLGAFLAPTLALLASAVLTFGASVMWRLATRGPEPAHGRPST